MKTNEPPIMNTHMMFQRQDPHSISDVLIRTEQTFIDYSSPKYSSPWHKKAGGCLTHTVTHTGKRADGINGEKSVKDLILLSGNGLKALKMKGLDALHHLVRMRSAVQIRPAAPKNHRFQMKTVVFVVFCLGTV